MAQSLKNCISQFFNESDNWKIQLLKNWQDVLGNLHTKVHLEKITDDTLTLSVADSCWLQELYLLSDVLLRAINQKLDKPRIKHLRFKKTGIAPTKKERKASVTKRSCKLTNLNAHEKNALEKIKDPQLKEALEHFLIRCYQEQE